jgi:hypothetical protein
MEVSAAHGVNCLLICLINEDGELYLFATQLFGFFLPADLFV